MGVSVGHAPSQCAIDVISDHVATLVDTDPPRGEIRPNAAAAGVGSTGELGEERHDAGAILRPSQEALTLLSRVEPIQHRLDTSVDA